MVVCSPSPSQYWLGATSIAAAIVVLLVALSSNLCAVESLGDSIEGTENADAIGAVVRRAMKPALDFIAARGNEGGGSAGKFESSGMRVAAAAGGRGFYGSQADFIDMTVSSTSTRRYKEERRWEGCTGDRD